MIIPGILEETFEDIREKVKVIEDVAPVIQIDIVDNTLVPGKTFLNVDRLGQLNSKSDITVHLMVENPVKFVKKSMLTFPFFKRKIPCVSTFITQIVDGGNLRNFIDTSKSLGYKVGLSINTDQDISLLDEFIKEIDLVQFMGVVPGKQGNDFIPAVFEKIKDFKTHYPAMKTQIDGGMNDVTLPRALKAGVDNMVVGSAIFKSIDPRDEFFKLYSLVELPNGTNIYN